MRTLSAFLFSCLLATTNAAHFKVEGRRRSHDSPNPRLLYNRAGLAGSSPLDNTADINYETNITLGGQLFTVLIDTGSSDLWVSGSIRDATDTGATASVTYAVGRIEGPIKQATLDFAGYSLPSQAYIEVTPDDTNAAGTGLIGLGPSSSSNIIAVTSADIGNTPLDHIFQQNKSAPNFLTVLMGRLNDPKDTFPGDLTVGEIVPGYEQIRQQPRLPVTEVSFVKGGTQHFQALLDEDGVLGPDGQPIPIKTDVSATSNKEQATVVFDTGFSLPQVPDHVAEAFYGRFNGSELQNVTGIGEVWVVPCSLEVNITFIFAGQRFPIHPLDATIDPTQLNMAEMLNSNGEKCCFGSFQPVIFDKASTYDMILGMAFLRNAYMLIDYGDFVHKTTTTADPYIQLLSTTNVTSETHNEFVQVRLDGKDNTGDITLGPGKTYSFKDSNPFKDPKKVRSIIIYVSIGVGALALIVGIFLLTKSRQRKRAQRYRPLHDPAPHAIPIAMHARNGSYAGGIAPSSGPMQYHDPHQYRR